MSIFIKGKKDLRLSLRLVTLTDLRKTAEPILMEVISQCRKEKKTTKEDWDQPSWTYQGQTVPELVIHWQIQHMSGEERVFCALSLTRPSESPSESNSYTGEIQTGKVDNEVGGQLTDMLLM